MKTEHKFIHEYASAQLERSAAEDRVNAALQAINPDNQVFGLQSHSCAVLLDALMVNLVGEELMDWVYWWMYEADHGTKHYDFSIDGREYIASELTLQQFLEIVDASN